ncbi:hypothetical protein HDU86_007087 [Geranomyces michiganensis]|nr:hypothetical protein HDU86_007087 [Geranomyces michiganensis]
MSVLATPLALCTRRCLPQLSSHTGRRPPLHWPQPPRSQPRVVLLQCRASLSTSSTTPPPQLPAPPARGWRKYANQLKSHPASHLVSFAILHELTAIIPLPLIYYLLITSDMSIPFPEDVLAEGNRRMSALCRMVGVNGLEEGSKVMLNMATAYAVVKVGMPLRIGVCLAATPWFARVAVVPVQTLFGRMRSLIAGVRK